MTENISMHEVSKVWADGLPAVQDFSAEFRPGTITALIGRNGSGKTTVLRLLAGLLKPDRGVVQRPSGSIGYLFQQGALWPHLTIRKQIALTLSLVSPNLDATAEVNYFLAKLKLDALADRYPAELSGGQQQRAAIARCLCVKPKVILVDEITGPLDPVAQAEIYAVLDVLKNENLTLVASTHDLSWVAKAADAVIYMVDSRVKKQGTWKEVSSDGDDPMFSAVR